MLKIFTNNTAELMGVRLRSGVMAWVQPGQTRELDVKDEPPAPPPAEPPARAKRKR